MIQFIQRIMSDISIVEIIALLMIAYCILYFVPLILVDLL